MSSLTLPPRGDVKNIESNASRTNERRENENVEEEAKEPFRRN